MSQPVRLYRVVISFCGHSLEERQTMAATPEEACNNIRYNYCEREFGRQLSVQSLWQDYGIQFSVVLPRLPERPARSREKQLEFGFNKPDPLACFRH